MLHFDEVFSKIRAIIRDGNLERYVFRRAFSEDAPYGQELTAEQVLTAFRVMVAEKFGIDLEHLDKDPGYEIRTFGSTYYLFHDEKPLVWWFKRARVLEPGVIELRIEANLDKSKCVRRDKSISREGLNDA